MRIHPVRALSSGALVAFSCVPALAQSNAVPGTDARIYNVVDVGYFGRRGAAYPNGEAGFGVGHSYCNSGTVNIPWVAYGAGSVMLDTYPKIAFMLARERDDRMVQISGRSHLKHSRAVFNFSSGPCAPCNSTGGQFMFVGCSDTYGSGTNSNRFHLGPTTEIDPWLGTWNSVGSYFDVGDPPVTGAAATDGVQSPIGAGFDAVKNRVEVREQELVGGGNFFGQVHLMIQGEPVQNRANNIMSRPCTIAWDGSRWNTGIGGTALEGSVLNQWSGATVDVAGNGQDDGRFAVGVKVTGPVGGMWHYEFAVHNLDNSRGAGVLRIPVDPGAVVANAGFRDLDVDPINDWTFARVGNEITFSAGAQNAVEWNTLYNFWFDCSVAPSFGIVTVDQARPGPGALGIAFNSEVPSGIPSARVQSVGTGCGECANSFYELFPGASLFDLGGTSLSMTLNGNQYSITPGSGVAMVPPTGTPLTLGLDSTQPAPLPFALPYPGGSTSTLQVCSNGFISAATGNGNTFTPSVANFLGGVARWAAAWHDFNLPNGGQVLVDASPTQVNVTWDNAVSFGATGTNTFQYQFFPNGDVNIVWGAMAGTGNPFLVGFSPGAGATDSGNRDLSTQAPFSLCGGVFTGIELSADARPVLGTTSTLTIADLPPGAAWAALVLSTQLATPPVDLTSIGMEGCQSHVVGGWSYFYLAPGSSTATALAVPNATNLISAVVGAQGFAWSPPLTTLGAVASNGLVLTLGL
ncbi:MAG: hypothetical protein AB7O97_15685 [Planctomycetota bacterium]